MVTVIIAAHNEQAVLGACLDSLIEDNAVSPADIIVSANACGDGTVSVARSRGVTTLDRERAGKASALNAAEDLLEARSPGTGRTPTSPRLYLDADITVPPGALARLLDRLAQDPRVHAAVPRRILASRDSTWPVRAYCAVNERLPVFRDGLFGRGMILLSPEGRSRFQGFPDVIADDLFLDAHFSAAERTCVPSVTVAVEAPRTLRDLLGRLERVRRGNAALREDAAAGRVRGKVRRSDKWSWWRDVVVPQPWLAPAAAVYVGVTLLATLRARRATVSWGRDDSTRRVAVGTTSTGKD